MYQGRLGMSFPQIEIPNTIPTDWDQIPNNTIPTDHAKCADSASVQMRRFGQRARDACGGVDGGGGEGSGGNGKPAWCACREAPGTEAPGTEVVLLGRVAHGRVAHLVNASRLVHASRADSDGHRARGHHAVLRRERACKAPWPEASPASRNTTVSPLATPWPLNDTLLAW